MNVLSYAELHRKGDEYHSNYIPRSNDNEDTLKAAAISNFNKKGVLKRQKKRDLERFRILKAEKNQESTEMGVKNPNCNSFS